MGIKVKKLSNVEETEHSWLHECPGCGSGHAFDSRWTFNGNLEKPTFSPSMLVNGPRQKDANGIPSTRCHYYLRGGMIQFLNDCDHELKGQTVECPDY